MVGLGVQGFRSGYGTAGHQGLYLVDELLFVALGVGETLHDPVYEKVHVVVFHVEFLLEFLVFVPELSQTLLSTLNGIPEPVGFVSDVHEIVLEAVVLVVQLHNLFFQEPHFLKQLLLLVFQVLLMSVVVDVF
jgi:hypothetical protein